MNRRLPLLPTLRADMAKYRNAGGWYRHPGFWCGATYRLGSWAHGVRPAPLRLALLGLYKVAVVPWRVVRNVSIPARVRIGPGLCLHHPHDILMPPEVEIGADCTLYHDVTLGMGPTPGVPRLGERVVIYAGARVIGGVKVGDDVEVGANAVVTRDVDPDSIVSAPPSRAIPRAVTDRLARPPQARPRSEP